MLCCVHRPAFECVLARLVRMRTELGIPNTPPLQRYQLRPKSLDTRNSSEKVGAWLQPTREPLCVLLGNIPVICMLMLLQGCW